MKWLLCKLLRHRWLVVSVNVRKHINLVRLHHMAGQKAVCQRCGGTWDDLWSPFFGDDVVTVPQLLVARAIRKEVERG
jgi:hypothetical protein